MLPRFAFAALASALLALLACSNQGEGERCDHNASNLGNDDCQNGLTCVQQNALTNGMGYDACCPFDRTQATTAVCSLNQATGLDAGNVYSDGAIDTFVAPPPDASSSDDAGQDAPAVDSAAAVDAPTAG